MKKLMTLAAAAVLAVSASAQTVQESKVYDNIYVGVNGGLATKTTGHSWMKGLDPNFGVRVGRWFTPVVGLAVESNAYFSNKPFNSTGTAVRFLNTSLLGTLNLSNLFGGYKGEPRFFEVIPVAGLGWGHIFGDNNERLDGSKAFDYKNNLTSKLGIDFAFNFGGQKQWQAYIEPSITYGLNDKTDRANYNISNAGVQYDINHSFVQLNAGVVYKFKNSNGTHNFKIVEPRNQAEIDDLNSQINDLRNQLAQKPKEVVKEVVKETPAKEVQVENLVLVTFAQGKSALTKEAKKALDAVKSGKHVQIVGTASPEGSKEVNDRLSQARADEVAKYLKKNGVIVDEANGKGVQGSTSNRLAVVYVK
jgi:OOP family OmpA-OmpF porin